MPTPGACDPLADACAEMAVLLRDLGMVDPETALQPVFTRLRARWGGDRPYIAKVGHEQREARAQAILEGLAAGQPVRAVAKKAGVHQATVRRALKEWAL